MNLLTDPLHDEKHNDKKQKYIIMNKIEIEMKKNRLKKLNTDFLYIKSPGQYLNGCKRVRDTASSQNFIFILKKKKW